MDRSRPRLGYVSERTDAAFYADAVDDVAEWPAGSPVRGVTP